MVGTDLNLDLPQLNEPLAQIVSKTRAALSSIEDSLADKVTSSALNINAALSFGGNHLTNLGGVVLVDGNVPVAEGSIYYTDGKFYVRDAAGPIQLTANGAINLAAVGAIGGDYGAGSESVEYDLASGEYRFKKSENEWASLVAKDVVLVEDSAEGGDYVRITIPALTASYDLTLPAQPPARTTMLQMDDAGGIIVSNTLAENQDIVISGTGDYKHGDQTFHFAFGSAVHGVSGGGVSFGSLDTGIYGWTLESNSTCVVAVPFLRRGWRVKHIYIPTGSFNGAPGNPSYSLILQRGFAVASGFSFTDNSGPSGGSLSIDNGGWVIGESSGAIDTLYIVVTAGSLAKPSFTSIAVTYDIP